MASISSALQTSNNLNADFLELWFLPMPAAGFVAL
jgi:hypothetical protein